MAVVCKTLNLVYFDVPKVACTTLKTWFWEVENGRPFPKPTLPARILRLMKGGGPPLYRSIHSVPGYTTKSHARIRAEAGDNLEAFAGIETLAVVRDPVARLFSAWSNKAGAAIFAARGETEDLRNMLLDTDPDFGTFIDNLDAYRSVSRPVRAHTQSYEWHLGPRLDAYDHIFEMEQMPALDAFLTARRGRPADLGQRNASGGMARPPGTLSPAQVDRLGEITAPDYAWLGGRYCVDTALKKLAQRFDRVA